MSEAGGIFRPDPVRAGEPDIADLARLLPKNTNMRHRGYKLTKQKAPDGGSQIES